MKVSLQHSTKNLNYTQLNQKSLTSTPISTTGASKSDSVSFTSKSSLAGEILDLIPKLDSKMSKSFNYQESGIIEFERGSGRKIDVEILDSRYEIAKQTLKTFSFFSKDKTQTTYSIYKAGGSKKQAITAGQYEILTEQLKKFAIPTILKKHGFENNNIIDILNELGLNLAKGKATPETRSAYQAEGRRLDGVGFKTKNNTTVSLLHDYRANGIVKIGFLSNPEEEMDVISLTDPKEIAKFKQIIKLKSILANKNAIYTQQKELEEAKRVAEETLDAYNLKMGSSIEAIDKKIENASKNFK